jgi:hypothetical protein
VSPENPKISSQLMLLFALSLSSLFREHSAAPFEPCTDPKRAKPEVVDSEKAFSLEKKTIQDPPRFKSPGGTKTKEEHRDRRTLC